MSAAGDVGRTGRDEGVSLKIPSETAFQLGSDGVFGRVGLLARFSARWVVHRDELVPIGE